MATMCHLQTMEKTASVQTQSLSGHSKHVWNGPTVVHTSAENPTMLEPDCHVHVQKDMTIKNAEYWKSLCKPVKSSSLLKSAEELFN